MTKQELIALAEAGHAQILPAYTITRYQVIRRGADHRGQTLDYPVIFMSITEEDGSVYDDYAYFTDGDDEVELDDADAERLRVLIQR
jgi:hypothetical protein